MINEATSLLAAFLRDPVHGINEMAGSIPRTRLGGLTDNPAPPVVDIYDDVDTASVAKDLTAPSLPAVLVWGDSSADITHRGYKIAKNVIVAVAYVTDDGVDDLVTNRECGYILRGGILTFNRYNSQQYSDGYRELNGIKILEISKVIEQRVTAAVGRQKMWGWLEVRCIVVETYS